MKILRFQFRGEYYDVNEAGHIKANGLPSHSPNWIFLGGSRHHWRNGIDVTRETAFHNPKSLNGCLGWDRDHGTIRQWGGTEYSGKRARIAYAHIVTQ